MAAEHWIAGINGSTTKWRIRVKILLKCFEKARDFGHTLEMVFVDEQRTKIHVSVPRRLAERYNDMFAENQWRIVNDFRVVNMVGASGVVRNNQRIVFTDYTNVDPTNYVNERYFFSFANYGSLMRGSPERNYSLDMIGYVIKTGEISMVHSLVTGPNTKKLTFRIQDEWSRLITCVAWGEIAQQIKDGVNNAINSNNVIIILRWWTLDTYSGTEIHTVDGKGRFMINPDIQETDTFANTIMTYWTMDELEE